MRMEYREAAEPTVKKSAYSKGGKAKPVRKSIGGGISSIMKTAISKSIPK